MLGLLEEEAAAIAGAAAPLRQEVSNHLLQGQCFATLKAETIYMRCVRQGSISSDLALVDDSWCTFLETV